MNALQIRSTFSARLTITVFLALLITSVCAGHEMPGEPFVRASSLDGIHKIRTS